MKILLFGDWRENAGPANVNKSLIQHADADMLYIKSAGGIKRAIEVFCKLLMCDVVVFSAYGGMKLFKIAKKLGKKVAILKHGDLKLEGEINHQFVPADQIADDKGFIVQLFECGEMDHVHCFITAPPKLSVTTIVKYLKGITGRKLFEKFPEIRSKLWKGELWNHSYYCETIGSVSEENIKRYIEHQSKSY